jgi:hypothetical protein
MNAVVESHDINSVNPKVGIEAVRANEADK